MIPQTTDEKLNKKLSTERKKELDRLAGNFEALKKQSLLNRKARRKAKETLLRRREWDFLQEISEKL